MTRKCKVCGERANHATTHQAWCDACWRSYSRLKGGEYAVAEWGAKRRAAASKKAGGK